MREIGQIDWRVGVEVLVFAIGISFVAAPGPSHAVDLLDPANGGQLTLVDAQLNAGGWAGANLADDNANSFWLSNQSTNDLVYLLSSTDETACVADLTLQNYGTSRSIRSFGILTTMDTNLAKSTGIDGWMPVPAELSPSGLVNHVHWGQGGRLVSVQNELNSTGWAGRNMHDGNHRNAWLSNNAVNTLEFAFDTNWDGSTGDAVNLDEIRLHNYGSNRSVSRFQIQVTTDGSNWVRVAVPGTAAGDPDFNFMLADEGAVMTRVDRQLNSTEWAGANIHDGSTDSIWLNNRSSNELDFEFDVDFDGTTGADGDSDDLFSIESLYIENYGTSRSVRLFQVEYRSLSEIGWTKMIVPGTTSGVPDSNFLLDWEGADLVRIDAQLNASEWAAARIHDGDLNTIWLSNRSVNELDFDFDVDGDGITGLAGDVDDLFSVDSLTLRNYGSNRSVRLFQIEVQTQGNPSWTLVEVPGTAAGDPDFNYALAYEGAVLSAIDGQLNTTSWAGSNLHDGDLATRWLMNRANNSMVFAFDTDADGSTGNAINIYTLRIYNYGSSRSVQNFEIDVQVGSAVWSSVAAPGGGTIFTAAQSGGAQNFSVGPLVGVTAVRLRTLSNYGDTYTGIAELELLGDSVGASHTFPAQRSATPETFALDAADRPAQVTALRFRSIQNYGDTYTGVRELEVNGDSIGPSHTFEAAQNSAGQTFVLAVQDRPVDVTAVRFRSIQNYGDTYTGLREFHVRGPAIRERYTFEPGRTAGPHVYTLDADHRIDGVVGAKFRSLNNYSDTYTGVRELELLGRPVGPSYLFSPTQSSSLQNFRLNPTAARVFRLRVYDNFGDTYVGAREIALGSGSGCGGVSSRFLIGHDGSGLQCSPESISVTAIDKDGLPATSYVETIILTSQTGTGDWSSDPGNQGAFSGANSGDGVAKYQFVAADSGVAHFSLNNVVGATSVDVDVYQIDNKRLRDDDSEGLLELSPSGFTLTANALPNPPTSPINDPIKANTAANGFKIHLAAYGTSPSDPTCGVIESYSGYKPIRFWVDHDDPVVAPLVPSVDGVGIASSELASAAQKVLFAKGQAVVKAQYKDVGRLTIQALDDTGTTYIRGSTDSFVSRPADLVIVAVEDTGGNLNPEVSSPAGAVFVRAGDPFVVRVEARDADGDRTPSYGLEATPEGIRLRSSSLVAPAGGRNGVSDDGTLANDESFASESPAGTFVGSSFGFNEVGAIRLTASVADGNYLGSGGLAGTESEVIGRFAPSRFEMTANAPVFGTACATGAFTWMGEPFEYRIGDEAELTVRAVNVAGETTENYAGAWWRMTNGSLTGRSYVSSGAGLVESGLPAMTSDPAIHSNDDGTGTLTFSTGSGLVFTRVTPIAPFDAEIQLSINVLDQDGTAYSDNPFVVGGTGMGLGMAFSSSNRFQFGRLRAMNANGSELRALPMSLRTELFDGATFIADGSDNCSQIPESALVLSPAPPSLSAPASIANNPLLIGETGLALAAPNLSGTVDVQVNLGPSGANLSWLRYDWPEDGNLDGVFDDDPTARATFGIWEGRRHLIYQREIY